MEVKSLKADTTTPDEGVVEAVFSTLNVVDKDGDITLASAFKDGQEVLISAYNHALWGGAMPVGKGSIHVGDNEAVLKGQFFLDTAAGKDTFNVIKHLGDRQEWSYGFNVLDSEQSNHNGQNVRVLKDLDVFEVSPVFIGAGVNTRTTSAKSAEVATEGVTADPPSPEMSDELGREVALFYRNSL